MSAALVLEMARKLGGAAMLGTEIRSQADSGACGPQAIAA